MGSSTLERTNHERASELRIAYKSVVNDEIELIQSASSVTHSSFIWKGTWYGYFRRACPPSFAR